MGNLIKLLICDAKYSAKKKKRIICTYATTPDSQLARGLYPYAKIKSGTVKLSSATRAQRDCKMDFIIYNSFYFLFHNFV